MRILHVVHQYPPEYYGGTELYTQTVAEALAVRGHEVTVFCRGAEAVTGNQGQVAVWPGGAASDGPARRFLATWRGAESAAAFVNAVDATRPDVVHIQHLMGLPPRMLDILTERRIPYVVTLHDYWWICPNAQLLTNYSGKICDGPAHWINCARCALARGHADWLWPAIPPLSGVLAQRARLLHRALRQATRLIAPTDFVRRWYAEHGAAEERIEVLPHGIEPGLPVQRAAENGRPIRFAAIGGLSWQKGIHVLVEAFNGLHAGPSGPAELWLGGDEAFDADYSRGLRAAAGRGVRFLGRLDRAQVWETLGQVDAVVVPSLWYETFSLITHEAFGAGLPVVASRLGVLEEAVRDGIDGLLVAPGNVTAWRAALQSLIETPETLAEMRRHVRSPLTLDGHTTRLEAIYRQVATG